MEKNLMTAEEACKRALAHKSTEPISRLKEILLTIRVKSGCGYRYREISYPKLQSNDEEALKKLGYSVDEKRGRKVVSW